MQISSFLLLGAAVFSSVLSHPDPANESLEVRENAQRYVRESIRALEKCQGELMENRELHRRTMERREAWVDEHVQKRGIKRRSLPFTKRHENEIFKRQVGCVLAPEVRLSTLESVELEGKAKGVAGYDRPLLSG